jgi:hypothetical protein
MVESLMRRCLLVIALAAVVAIPAQADFNPTFFFNESVDVVFGMAQLFSPSDVLLSTTTALAADGGGFSAGTVLHSSTSSLTMSSAQAAFLQSQVDQSIVQQIQADSTVPSRFSTGLQNLIDANGLGAPDPFTTVSNIVTNQPSNFALTSDTGFASFGTSLQFEYILQVNDFPVSGQAVDGIANVNFWERDLKYTETPEPGRAAFIPILFLAAALPYRARNRALRAMHRFRTPLLAVPMFLTAFALPSWCDLLVNFDATTPINSFFAAVGVIDPALVYNPSVQGPISTLDFSIQTDQILNYSSLQTTIGSRAVIYQNGEYYTAQATAPYEGNGVFVTDSATGWTANDFGLFNLTNSTIVDSLGNTLGPGGIDSNIHPDFSSSGGPIEVGTGGLFGFTCGFGQAADLTCPFQLQESIARRNMSYRVNDPTVLSTADFGGNLNIIDFVYSADPSGSVSTDVTATPEPDSVFFLAACFLFAVLSQLRRQKLRRS